MPQSDWQWSSQPSFEALPFFFEALPEALVCSSNAPVVFMLSSASLARSSSAVATLFRSSACKSSMTAFKVATSALCSVRIRAISVLASSTC